MDRRLRAVLISDFNLDNLAAYLKTEDLQRTAMYQAELRRKERRRPIVSLDDFLATLETEVRVQLINDANMARSAQLLNKTNQFNLATRRLSQPELSAWSSKARHWTWTFRVRDKFGDSGLTGLASLAAIDGKGELVDFLLSCRVMCRNIELVMIHVVLDHAKSLGLKQVEATFIPTMKNNPCLRFLEQHAVKEPQSESTFHWNAECVPEVPADIRLLAE